MGAVEEDLGDLLFSIDCIRVGYTGETEPVIIIELREKPPGDIPFREYQGYPVVWKVKGDTNAL